MHVPASPWRRIGMSLLLAVALSVPLFSLQAQAARADALKPAALPPVCNDLNMNCLPPNCNDASQNGNCNDAVTLHGGSVEHDPVVYLIFWGPKWTDSNNGNFLTFVNAEIALQNLFGSLAGTAYNAILSQYCDSQDCVHNDVRLGGVWFDSDGVPGSAGTTDFENEITLADAANGWKGSANSQVMVFPEEGSTSVFFDGACGQHMPVSRFTTAWSFVRYGGDGSCNFWDNVAESMTNTAAHEYAETATDPDGPNIPGLSTWGWATTNPVTNPIEIADKCQGYNGGYDASAYDGTVKATVPYLWDHTISECVPIHGTEYPSPDSTAPFHGVHTVQGAIGTEYTNLSGASGLLGQPLTEQMPLGGGQVSYFAGQFCNGGHAIPLNQGYGSSGQQSGSAIFQAPGVSAAYEVHGCIYADYWQNEGGPTGALGWPTRDQCTANSAGDQRSLFQHGSITRIHATGQIVVQVTPNPPLNCQDSTPARVAISGTNTFVAIGNTLYKYDLGDTGHAMFSLTTNGTSGPDYIGNQVYSSPITALAVNGQYLYVALGSDRVVKTTLCGSGNNMCALSDGNGSGSVSGYHYWIGYQDFSVAVTGLAATTSYLFTNLVGGSTMRTLKTTLCGSGSNMCALSDRIGTAGLTGYSYWVGRQDWAWAPTAIAANDSILLTTIGSIRVCKTTLGSSGTNVLALSDDGICLGNYPGYHNWFGYQDWSQIITNLAVDGSHIWWSLGRFGRLVQTTWCGPAGSGSNMCLLQDDIGTSGVNGTSYWVGRQDWCAGYTQMGAGTNGQFIDSIFFTGSLTRVVKAVGGSGANMFATSDCTGTGSLGGYSYWIGNQDYTVS